MTKVMLQECLKQNRDLMLVNREFQRKAIEENAESNSLALGSHLQKIHYCVRRQHEENQVPKCPRCNSAFGDFDGCLSLLCESCKANFCGICLLVLLFFFWGWDDFSDFYIEK
jgi:hypothetical protein